MAAGADLHHPFGRPFGEIGGAVLGLRAEGKDRAENGSEEDCEWEPGHDMDPPSS